MFINLIKIGLFIALSFGKVQNEFILISWNIKDFGKSRDDDEIIRIAKLIKHADIVAIQEVVAKDSGGAQAVARLVDQLNRMGAKWDYIVSNPTKSTSSFKSERYALIWKTKKIKLYQRNASLIKELETIVEREPHYLQLQVNKRKLMLLNYHATTHTKNYPERAEIKAISKWIISKEFENLIWAGDMNLNIKDKAFYVIKNKGYNYCIKGEKTTLKRKCENGNYLSRGEDNIIFKLKNFKMKSVKVIDFIKDGKCEDVIWKRNSYSDHLPIEFRFTLK